MGVYENHKTNLNSARIHKWRALEYEEVMYTLVLLTDKCKQIPLGRLCPHTFPGWLYLYGVAAGDAPGCRRGDVCWACTSLDEPFPQQDTDKHRKPSRAIRAHKKSGRTEKASRGAEEEHILAGNSKIGDSGRQKSRSSSCHGHLTLYSGYLPAKSFSLLRIK